MCAFSGCPWPIKWRTDKNLPHHVLSLFNRKTVKTIPKKRPVLIKDTGVIQITGSSQFLDHQVGILVTKFPDDAAGTQPLENLVPIVQETVH